LVLGLGLGLEWDVVMQSALHLMIIKTRSILLPPTMGKQLVNVITCGCESSAPFLVIYKTVLVIGLYELDPTT